MQPWLYALMFIALMMGIALATDRHGYRLRRPTIRGSSPTPAAPTSAFARQPSRPQPRRPRSRRPQPHGHGGSAGGQ